MKAKRGRPRMKPTIKRLIYSKAIKDKETPRLALAVELKNLIEEMGENPPSEETMIRLISQVRNHPISPLDEDWWQLSSLAEYNISAEVVPLVMSILEEIEYLTIREVLWIGRLYKVVESYQSKHLTQGEIPTPMFPWHYPVPSDPVYSERALEARRSTELKDLVGPWAHLYASAEMLSEMQGESFNSEELDFELKTDVYNAAGEWRTIQEIRAANKAFREKRVEEQHER
jgi:hypothetical protein